MLRNPFSVPFIGGIKDKLEFVSILERMPQESPDFSIISLN